MTKFYQKKGHSPKAQGTKSHAPMATDQSFQGNIQWSPSRWLMGNLCNWLGLFSRIRNAYPGDAAHDTLWLSGWKYSAFDGCMNETKSTLYTLQSYTYFFNLKNLVNIYNIIWLIIVYDISVQLSSIKNWRQMVPNWKTPVHTADFASCFAHFPLKYSPKGNWGKDLPT